MSMMNVDVLHIFRSACLLVLRALIRVHEPHADLPESGAESWTIYHSRTIEISTSKVLWIFL